MVVDHRFFYLQHLSFRYLYLQVLRWLVVASVHNTRGCELAPAEVEAVLVRDVTLPDAIKSAIADKLAEAKAYITMLRAFVDDCVTEHLAGFISSEKAAMAKLVATDAAMKVTTDAVQVLGGAGYTQDFPAERYMREAKVTQIFEGTNQIQRIVVARNLL